MIFFNNIHSLECFNGVICVRLSVFLSSCLSLRLCTVYLYLSVYLSLSINLSSSRQKSRLSRHDFLLILSQNSSDPIGFRQQSAIYHCKAYSGESSHHWACDSRGLSDNHECDACEFRGTLSNLRIIS